ncbi:MAG: hypothetical protein CMH83_09160 [Nocardioides sp.]|nr:hypothetical protein [Nocardioides sp.]
METLIVIGGVVAVIAVYVVLKLRHDRRSPATVRRRSGAGRPHGDSAVEHARGAEDIGRL